MAFQTAIIAVRLSTKLTWSWFLGSVCSGMDFDNLGVDKLVMANAIKGCFLLPRLPPPLMRVSLGFSNIHMSMVLVVFHPLVCCDLFTTNVAVV